MSTIAERIEAAVEYRYGDESDSYFPAKAGAAIAAGIYKAVLHDLLDAFDLACRFASPPEQVINNLEAARKRAVEAMQ